MRHLPPLLWSPLLASCCLQAYGEGALPLQRSAGCAPLRCAAPCGDGGACFGASCGLPAPLFSGSYFMNAALGPDCRLWVSEGMEGPSELQIYDPATNGWSVLPAPDGAAGSSLAFGTDDRLYLAYGANDLTPWSLAAYEPITGVWTKAAPLPSRRYAFGVGAGPDGLIYAVGGSNGDEGAYATVEAYDPASDGWESRPDAPIAVAFAAMTVGLDGRLYAIGGDCNYPGCQAVPFQAYDVFARRWTVLPSPPMRGVDPSYAPALRLAAAAAGLDGRIYVVGGECLDCAQSLLAYDPSSRIWADLGPTALPEALAAAVAPDGRLYAMGGEPLYQDSWTTRPLSQVSAYSIADGRWLP